MPVRAFENHVYTITANRYGQESNQGELLTFIGQSVICGPDSSVLVKAPEDEDCVGAVDIDPSVARNRQITAFNDLLEDRRTDTYVAEVLREAM